MVTAEQGMGGPLSGIKVVEIGTSVAAPYATWILAALGADVVKVERPEGDDARHWGPPFWHGAAALSGECRCDCHGDPDPNCDGLTDLIDAVLLVNVAFRNAAAIPDPSPTCPVETTDLDCNGATDIVDAVMIVNVAFRNFDPQTTFCQPCEP